MLFCQLHVQSSTILLLAYPVYCVCVYFLRARCAERIYDVVEAVEENRPGGYHPVHLHDLFNQRYQIMGKLAYGQFSTVWLASDQKLQRHVALKYLRQMHRKAAKSLPFFSIYQSHVLNMRARDMSYNCWITLSTMARMAPTLSCIAADDV
ncbi:hypothetical protein V1505DRAFT_139879 [Lipomyces doorenjongii]